MGSVTADIPEAGDAPIVINADDLGRDSAVNGAVMEAFHSGLVSDASLMANMPGFLEACQQVREAGLQDDIGVHLNLTQGLPLTLPIRAQSTFCDPTGEFHRRGSTIWRLTAAEAQAVRTELAAQLDAVLAEGIVPTHLDTHHHSHTQWPVGAIVNSIALRYDVPAVRLSRNCGTGMPMAKRAYKSLYNARLARAGLARTRYFGNAADVLSLARVTFPVEAMVHPERHPDGEVVDCYAASRFDDAQPLHLAVDRLKAMGRMVSYRSLIADARGLA